MKIVGPLKSVRAGVNCIYSINNGKGGEIDPILKAIRPKQAEK